MNNTNKELKIYDLQLTVLLSRMTEAVSPAADEPLPEVYTATGAVFSTNLRNYTQKSIKLAFQFSVNPDKQNVIV